LYQTLGQNNQKLFCKKSNIKDFIIIFLEEKIVLQMNYLKRKGQASGAIGMVHWEKWVAALGRCGKERRDEK
jgi:hypothetical protein